MNDARLAVITGSGSGIGSACARRLAADGCDVVLVGRRRDALEDTAAAVRELGAVARVMPADVSDPEQVQELADNLAADSGDRISVLVNNAGSRAAAKGSTLADLADAWTQTYRANTVSAVLMTTALEPLLADAGRIVLVGSRAAQTGAATDSYTAAKAALEGYARAIAPRFAPRGITVNVVAPGYIEDTELTQGHISAERRARLLASVTLNRPGTSDEIAAAVAFLAGSDASYLTGEVLAVDGGYSPWHGPSA